MESYIDSNAVNMGALKNILVNLQGILQKGSKNIKKLLPPYLTIVTPQVIKSPSTISQIVGREDQNLTRAIKEALFIRVNDPSLNRNIGKYHLPHIWDEVLHTTSELKLK